MAKRNTCREKNPRWKGGEFISNGYLSILKPDHPNSRKTGYIKRCRLIMSEHLGRPLAANELVHHINGDKLDDRIENLVVLTRSGHITAHITGDSNPRHTDFRTKACPNCGNEFMRTNINNFVRNKCCSLKCRTEYYRGARSNHTKITQETADKIKSLKGILPSRKIALAFSLSPTHVKRILRGDAW